MIDGVCDGGFADILRAVVDTRCAGGCGACVVEEVNERIGL